MRKPPEVTREDATGFKKKSFLDSISTSAMDENWKRAKKSRGPVLETEQPAKASPEPAPSPKVENVAADFSADKEITESATTPPEAPVQPTSSPAEKLVRYVAPPGPQKTDNVSVSITLRVLKRHADQLDQIAQKGGDPNEILGYAVASMVRPTYKPVFQPQVMEPTGARKYTRRTSARIPKDTLDAIISNVENGDRLPRASLIVGQIEAEWFKALEEAIKRASS